MVTIDEDYRKQVLDIIKQEGDYLDFINPLSNYECYLRRNPRTGAWCGYVKLPEDHPFYEYDYMQLMYMGIRIKVHGGLSFSNDGVFGFDCSHAKDFYPFANFGHMTEIATVLNDFVEVIGEHYGDDEQPREIAYRTKEYAIDQVHKMAEQFYNFRTSKIKEEVNE